MPVWTTGRKHFHCCKACWVSFQPPEEENSVSIHRDGEFIGWIVRRFDEHAPFGDHDRVGLHGALSSS